MEKPTAERRHGALSLLYRGGGNASLLPDSSPDLPADLAALLVPLIEGPELRDEIIMRISALPVSSCWWQCYDTSRTLPSLALSPPDSLPRMGEPR